MTKQRLNEISKDLEPCIKQINVHPLYNEIKTLDDLQFFVEQHVFAVWDFMCLLKTLYARLVCNAKLWYPPSDAYSVNLIGQIMLEEESDLNIDGQNYCSHFELYVSVMEQIEADTRGIKAFISKIKKEPDCDIYLLLDQMKILSRIRYFVNTTLKFLSKPTHQLAAAFVFGSEAITTVMFTPILEQIDSAKKSFGLSENLINFHYYFSRHIELDDEQHYPKALKMLEHLIKDDENHLKEVKEAALIALEARQRFLTDIYKYLHERK